MFQHMDATGDEPKHLKIVTIGGSAAPRAMIERLMKMGIRVGHAWGMTETSPIGTIGAPPANWDELSFDEQVDLVCKQGGCRSGSSFGSSTTRARSSRATAKLGPAADPRPLGDQALFPGRGRRLRRRGQLVRHRRRRRHPSLRHDADHRPLQGRDQVGRRVDQLGRPGKCRGRLPGRRRGGGDRRQSSEMGRAAAAAGGAQAGLAT